MQKKNISLQTNNRVEIIDDKNENFGNKGVVIVIESQDLEILRNPRGKRIATSVITIKLDVMGKLVKIYNYPEPFEKQIKLLPK